MSLSSQSIQFYQETVLCPDRKIWEFLDRSGSFVYGVAMDFSLFKKFKFILVILVSWYFFNSCIGLVQSAGEYGVVSVVFHPEPLRVLGISMVLAFAAAVFGALMDKTHYREFALTAVASGFTAWAMKTGLIDHLLMSHNVSSERATLFYRLILDSFLWLAIGAGGYLGAVVLARITKWAAPIVDPGESNSSHHLENTHSPKTKVLAFGFVFLVSLILLKLLVRSNPAALGGVDSIAAGRGPNIGQIVFVVFISFYIASAIAAGFWLTMPVSILLAVPPVIAAVSYLLASQFIVAQSLLDQSSLFVNPSVIFSIILPIQFIAIGSLGVLAGYGLTGSGGLRLDQAIKTGWLLRKLSRS